MTTVNAQTRMKALVASQLLMGDMNDWKAFEQEREAARKIANRHAARSVSSQIGRGYRELTDEIQKFILKNFSRCDYGDLALLCDAIEPGAGLYVRLDEFEKQFFPWPIREAPVSFLRSHQHFSLGDCGSSIPNIPTFSRNINAGLETSLKETRVRLGELGVTDANMKSKRHEIAPLLSREKNSPAAA